jgi:hypothetical protein
MRRRSPIPAWWALCAICGRSGCSRSWRRPMRSSGWSAPAMKTASSLIFQSTPSARCRRWRMRAFASTNPPRPAPIWATSLAASSPRPPAASALHDQWVSCALSNIEPHATRVFACDRFFARNETTATIRAAAAGELQRNLPVIDGHLAGQAFLMGLDLCVADIMLCMIADSELMSALPSLQAYMARLQARPAFQRALALNGGLQPAGA